MRANPVSSASSSFSVVIGSNLISAICLGSILCAPALGQRAVDARLASLGGADECVRLYVIYCSSRALITQAVDESRLTTLQGNTHPMARAEFDLGTAPASLPMERMLLVLKRSPAQETSLRKLLDDQQDKASPNYHRWLTPADFGRQFGPADSDMQIVTSWLQSHGFHVGSTRGRTVLEFSGSASQVQEAFHTTIHKYLVNGEQHWANATDPMIPTALTPVVAGILSLHNFLKKPQNHFIEEPALAKIVPGEKPQVTFPLQNGQPQTNALGPQDYATIYDINPVYSNGINGNGVFVGVVGRSNLFGGGNDVVQFMSVFGLCCSGNFQVVLNGPDPGDLGGGEEAEATLDSSWSKAVAPLASVNLVVSASTNTTDGVDLSELYIVEGNNYDVMTESFSSCELYATDAQLAGASALAKQAAAQGITYMVSTGDDGAAGCDDPSSPPATHPNSVNLLASTAFNVAVGGTMFNENGNNGTYWSNTPPISETALSYIPENVWNESSSVNGLWAGSGGASAGNVQSGGTTAGIPKPGWQSGVAGIPADRVRDLPDVSLTAAGHDPYLLCLRGSCVPNNQGEIFVYFISGTSASAPAFAGVMALVDEQMAGGNGQSSRQGQANYVLYRLAASQSAYPTQCNGSNVSGPPASSCIFNDITVGNNQVPGEQGGQYSAGAAYDLATGLGSVNVANLVSQWNSVSFSPTITTLTLPASTITHGSPLPFTVTVKPNSGSGVPTGDVALVNSGGGGIGLGPFVLSGGSLSGTVSSIPGGVHSFAANYAGDITYAPSRSPGSAQITVTPEPSSTTETVLVFDQKGNSLPLSNIPFGSLVYLRADVAGQSGFGVPTGTVNFADTFGSIPNGGPVTLNSAGNTSVQTLGFDAGAHTISASYQGDASFDSSATTQTTNFTVAPGFFLIPWTPSVINISSPGQSAWLNITEDLSSGFTSTVTFTGCSGLPAESTCTFGPSSVSMSVITVTVTTTAPHSAANLRAETRSAPIWLMGGFVLAGVFLVPSRDAWKRRVALVLTIMVLLIAVPACGGGGGGNGGGTHQDSGTPLGSYPVTVTATAGSLTQTTSFLLVVQ